MITNWVSVQSKPIFNSQKRDKIRLSFQRSILPLKILFVENNLPLKKEKKKKTKYRAIIFDASMSAEERVFPKREKKSSKRN